MAIALSSGLSARRQGVHLGMMPEAAEQSRDFVQQCWRRACPRQRYEREQNSMVDKVIAGLGLFSLLPFA